MAAPQITFNVKLPDGRLYTIPGVYLSGTLQDLLDAFYARTGKCRCVFPAKTVTARGVQPLTANLRELANVGAGTGKIGKGISLIPTVHLLPTGKFTGVVRLRVKVPGKLVYSSESHICTDPAFVKRNLEADFEKYGTCVCNGRVMDLAESEKYIMEGVPKGSNPVYVTFLDPSHVCTADLQLLTYAIVYKDVARLCLLNVHATYTVTDLKALINASWCTRDAVASIWFNGKTLPDSSTLFEAGIAEGSFVGCSKTDKANKLAEATYRDIIWKSETCSMHRNFVFSPRAGLCRPLFWSQDYAQSPHFGRIPPEHCFGSQFVAIDDNTSYLVRLHLNHIRWDTLAVLPRAWTDPRLVPMMSGEVVYLLGDKTDPACAKCVISHGGWSLVPELPYRPKAVVHAMAVDDRFVLVFGDLGGSGYENSRSVLSILDTCDEESGWRSIGLGPASLLYEKPGGLPMWHYSPAGLEVALFPKLGNISYTGLPSAKYVVDVRVDRGMSMGRNWRRYEEWHGLHRQDFVRRSVSIGFTLHSFPDLIRYDYGSN